jgi:hypothetical protein
MGVSGMWYAYAGAYGGSDGYSWSAEVNIAPSYASAQTSLSHASGDGLCASGITKYRVRPDPGGQESEVDNSWDNGWGYPPAVWDPHLSSATGQVDVGADQTGVFVLNVFTYD